jgi:hypothetical protein
LGRYIKIGADRLLQERAKQFGYGTFRLLIVTDGEAEDRTLVDKYTPDVIGRGIRVDVIGVAMAANHTLARRVHSYRAAHDPASLRRALSEVFAEVGGNRGDKSDAEVFELLEPISAEVASAAIQALANSDNRPIGERSVQRPGPKATSTPEQKPATPPSAAPRNSAPAVPEAAPPQPTGATQSPPPASRSRGSWISTALVAVVVLMIARAWLGRNRRR